MIEANLWAQINHVSGPWVAERDHVYAWLVADGVQYVGDRMGFTFPVCAEHAEPEECEHEVANMAVFRAEISAVGAPGPQARQGAPSSDG